MSTQKKLRKSCTRLNAAGEPPQKRRRNKRILITVGIIVGVIVLMLGILYGIFARYYNMMNRDTTVPSIVDSIPHDDDYDPTATDSDQSEIDDADKQIEENLGNEVVFENGVYNLLMIGTDARNINNERGRSDSMIVVSINENTKTITMTSIMRDTYIRIPGLGNNRINAAYSHGGAPLLVDTIEQNFGIKIDNYVIANFTAFKDIVDQVGGVDIEISEAEIKVMNRYIKEYNTEVDPDEPDEDSILSASDAGMKHLNGKQALAYCRVRYVGNGDFGRTARQRAVIDAILQKCKTMGVGELNDLAETVLPWLTVDLSMTDAMALATKGITSYLGYEIQSYRIPADKTWRDMTVNGASVLSIDFEENRDLFFQNVYGKTYEELVG